MSRSAFGSPYTWAMSTVLAYLVKSGYHYSTSTKLCGDWHEDDRHSDSFKSLF